MLMCGITGYLGKKNAAEKLLTGLDNLEYRGYDSAGIALKNGHGIDIIKRAGEVAELQSATRTSRRIGKFGIGHTRWSTHGKPSDANAHPHTDCSGNVAVVHNGIIDNYDELRARLQDDGHEFTSDTDTEVIPHLVEEYLADGLSVEKAFRRTIEQLTGSYAIAMVVADKDAIFATRSGSPLVLGIGDQSYHLASDVPAFLEFTEDVVYIEDGDVVELTPTSHRITDGDGYMVDRPVQTVEWTPQDAEKGGYDHYMLKEIHEQPTALERAIRGRVFPDDTKETETVSSEIAEMTSSVSSVQFVACGTSYHAALYGEQLLGNRGIRARTSLASEFVVNPPPMDDDTIVVGVTQSGETADTLEALRTARARGHRTLAVTNVIGSTAARECDDALFIRAGPEIGVAATKTFSSQVLTLSLLADHLGTDSDEQLHEALEQIPSQVQSVLDTSDARSVAQQYSGAESYFFVGRGVAKPVALEGALKLKEISYEHAEGFPAGELKHGPLALVTENTPVFAILTGENEDRMRGTIKEVSARNAPVIAVTDTTTPIEGVDDKLQIPETDPELAGVLANVQLQLLSYHTATLLNRPVDKPRNLAKSVTVE